MSLTRDDELLLVDYQASLELLKHEDERKSHMFSIFFLVQGALFGYFSLATEGSPAEAAITAAIAILASIFWYFVMERMQAFVELRYHQLQYIESRVGIISTITNEETLRSKKSVKIGDYQYTLPKQRSLFSISKQLESRLPIVVGAFWLFLIIETLLGI